MRNVFDTFTCFTPDNVHQVAAGGVVAHGGWGSLASAGKAAVYMPPLLCSLTVCSSAVCPGSLRDYHVSEYHGLPASDLKLVVFSAGRKEDNN